MITEQDFDIVRSGGGPNPWRAVYGEYGTVWASVAPIPFDHPDLGGMMLTGNKFFRTKRACLVSLRRDLEWLARLEAGLCPRCGTKRGDKAQLHTCTPTAEVAP